MPHSLLSRTCNQLRGSPVKGALVTTWGAHVVEDCGCGLLCACSRGHVTRDFCQAVIRSASARFWRFRPFTNRPSAHSRAFSGRESTLNDCRQEEITSLKGPCNLQASPHKVQIPTGVLSPGPRFAPFTLEVAVWRSHKSAQQNSTSSLETPQAKQNPPSTMIYVNSSRSEWVFK